MFTPESEGYEPAIITGTPTRGGEGIRRWEPAIKENIGTTTPTNNRSKYLYQKQSTPIKQWNSDNTSLTPLIERHSLRDVNPFYQASESDIAETPGMIVTPNSSFTTYNETPSRMYSIQSKLDDEMRRMEQLQDDLLEIKEQCAFLAGRSSKAPATPLREIPSWRTRTPIEERRSFIDPSPYKIQKTTHTPLRTSFTTTTAAATPSRSSAYREYSTTPLSHRHHNYNNSNSISKDKIVPLASSSTPLSTRTTEKTTPLVRTPYKTTSNISNNDDSEKELKTPDNTTQEFLEQISSAKLKSAEVIRTPGGSRVANKFWKEIHGSRPKTVSPPPPLTLSSYSPIAKRPTQDAIPLPPPPPSSLKRSWTDSEDAFWSETNSKTPNSVFNSRLFKAAQEEGIMSLEDELNSAAQKEANKPKPKLNPDMIAELKAKHRERFLDDSDSYKFA